MHPPIPPHQLLHQVPFIANHTNNLHCLQASYGMIRQYFEPAWRYDLARWAPQTGFEPGRGSWSFAGLLWFYRHGYSVSHISKFDYRQFAADPAAYILAVDGPEAGRWIIDITNLPAEQVRAEQFLAADLWQERTPDLEDIKLYLERGYLLKCTVNLNSLNQLPGYLGHALLVIGYDDDSLVLHDPGLPPRPYRVVPHAAFMAAWSSPNAFNRKLDVIKRSQ